jgi:hypothetical protein
VGIHHSLLQAPLALKVVQLNLSLARLEEKNSYVRPPELSRLVASIFALTLVSAFAFADNRTAILHITLYCGGDRG